MGDVYDARDPSYEDMVIGHAISAGTYMGGKKTVTKQDKLRKQKESLIAYIYTKIEAEDWHAVQDAAADIRVVEAKLEVLGA